MYHGFFGLNMLDQAGISFKTLNAESKVKCSLSCGS